MAHKGQLAGKTAAWHGVREAHGRLNALVPLKGHDDLMVNLMVTREASYFDTLRPIAETLTLLP